MERRRNGKKVHILQDLPADLFCEVASLLTPSDVLKLLETAKFLRQFLLRPAAVEIWQVAERGSGLPECPPDLTHPQYARLVYGKVCMLCLDKPQALKLLIPFRVRLCESCFYNNIVYGRTVSFWRTIQERFFTMRDDIYWLVPAIAVSRCNGRYFASVKWSAKLSFNPDHQSSCCIFYYPAFKAAFDLYSSLPSDDERRKFASERREAVRQVKEHASRLLEWDINRKEEIKRVNARMRAIRRKEIYARLRRSGCTDADLNSKDDEKDWKWKVLIEQPRELTNKAWNNVQGKLMQTISSRRDKADAKKQELADRRRALPHKLVHSLYMSVGSSPTKHDELVELGRSFACLRCFSPRPMTWHELVVHFLEQNDFYASMSGGWSEENLFDKHNWHCISTTARGPLARYVPGGEGVQAPFTNVGVAPSDIWPSHCAKDDSTESSE